MNAPLDLAQSYARKVGGMQGSISFAIITLRVALEHPARLDEMVREAIAELQAAYEIGNAPNVLAKVETAP